MNVTMDRTSIRAWRRIQQQRVWRKRLTYYFNQQRGVGTVRVYIDGYELAYDHGYGCWKDLKKEHWCQLLRHTGTLCSCWMCRNYLYDREEYKRDTRRILREQSEE